MRHFIHRPFWQIGAVLAATFLLCMQAGAQEGIVLDPATGNYTITYRSDGGLSMTTYIPSNKIVPDVRSSFKLTHAGGIVYRYAIANGAMAKMAIRAIYIDDIPGLLLEEHPWPSAPDTLEVEGDAMIASWDRALRSPPNWDKRIDPFENAHRVGWRAFDSDGNPGILPGSKATGFGFASLDILGIMPIKLEGFGSGIVYADEGPAEDDPIIQQIDQLRDNDFVAKPVAAPMVSVPVPFDPAVTLERLQTHTHSWIAMQLLDATFSAQLDRYFQSAISAYRLNQPKVGKKHIQTMRELIEKEQPEADKEEERDERDRKDDDHDHHRSAAKRALIDPLAARILDFDLKYVTKRMGGDKDD